jgi:hypothetical protein
MFTGQLPHEHGVHSYDYDFSKLSHEDTFLSVLPDHSTLGVSANPFASSFFGFDSLFDLWVDVRPELLFLDGMAIKQFTWEHDSEGLELYIEFIRQALKDDHPAKSVVNGVYSKLQNKLITLPIPRVKDYGGKRVSKYSKRLIERSSEPFFLFANFMDAHGPYRQIRAHDTSIYNAPNNWSSTDFDKVGTNLTGGLTDDVDAAHYRGIYNADIDYLDRLVSGFISDLKDMSEHPTVFLITADHGQNLAYNRENDLIAHMGTLSEGTLHVPLDLVVPWRESETLIKDYTSHIQLPELLEELVHGGLPEITTNHPRAEIIGGAGAQGRLSEDDDQWDYWTRVQRCVYSETQKCWWDSLGGSNISEIEENHPNVEYETGETFDVDEFDRRWFAENIDDVDRVATDSINQKTASRLHDLGYL